MSDTIVRLKQIQIENSTRKIRRRGKKIVSDTWDVKLVWRWTLIDVATGEHKISWVDSKKEARQVCANMGWVLDEKDAQPNLI